MTEPENLVLALLREMRDQMATKGDMARIEKSISDVDGRVNALAAAVASDLVMLEAKVEKSRKEVSEQIVGLRRAVVEYHSSAIGHGILLGEFEERLRRVEQHLNLPGQDTH